MEMSNAENTVLDTLKRELMDVVPSVATFTFMLLMVFGLNWLVSHLLYWTDRDYHAIDWAARLGEYALSVTATLILLASLLKFLRNVFLRAVDRR